MVSHTNYSEDALVEQPAIALFSDLEYETANCYNETFGEQGTLGRETSGEVILVPRLRAALERLNPDLPSEAISFAIEELGKDRSMMSPAQANREVYKLLKNRFNPSLQSEEDEENDEKVKIIDWNNPENNDFFLASQFWVSGEIYKRRADLVGFINGLPLIFIELKKSHSRLENAYKHNLRDYKNTIPQLFWYNAFIILSNGSEAKVGSITAGWEHFADWKRINDEGEQGVVSLETMIRGTCEKTRFLDIVENFIVFEEAKGGLIKLVAKNHQYLGVNKAINALDEIQHNQGKLGVFWHTQGSGKSFSMVFFSQKVLRKVPGNWTFVVVTDRDDLDDQIAKNFKNTGAVTEEHIQATSGDHLKQLLTEDHRQIFTLIQKFHTNKGEKYDKLSDRSDIIVIADEAHRSQYDTFALNMRNALPNAAFIAFTGTPLMAGEEKTKKVFGDYVSIYNFRQSIEDGATVPLFYENRIPELQLTNEHLKEDLEDLIEAADLDEEQQKKLERTFAREYHLITRDDRLEKVAEDLVSHFMGRGVSDKGMVVCIDRFTAVKMYDKVQKYWKAYLGDLKARLAVCDVLERPDLIAKIKFMEETDMAVVISSAQNEVEEFQKKGLDIETHRKRMIKEDLETKFKDPSDPFRIVFVCAMWMTGFDAPCVSTIYLDKPMRNHTLMQTIARANRVFGEKNNGLIVDYVGVFRDLQKALAIYGSAAGGGVKEGETPVQDKEELIKALRVAIDEANHFCQKRGVSIEPIINSAGFQRVAFLDDAAANLVDKQVVAAVDDAVEKVIVNDELKKQFILLANDVVRLYKAILPDHAANEFAPIKACFAVLMEKIRSFLPEVSVEEVMVGVEQLLDESISPTGYEIKDSDETSIIDLGKIDFEGLKDRFTKGRKRTEAEKLKRRISGRIQQMVRLNKSRIDYLETFKQLIDEYNSGLDVQIFFDRLLAFAKDLSEEEQRGVAEQLSEEELAVFDILTKPEIEMTDAEINQVKKAAKGLLETLKTGKLVLDWRKKQQARADVLRTVEMVLDESLPRAYTPELFRAKCDLIYRHIYDSYYGEERSIYAGVA
ncbi:MAG: type I restriction endonuclease subunit R [Thermoguttaceae bacterium]|jgi:type I restriction enzyme R subunit